MIGTNVLFIIVLLMLFEGIEYLESNLWVFLLDQFLSPSSAQRKTTLYYTSGIPPPAASKHKSDPMRSFQLPPLTVLSAQRAWLAHSNFTRHALH